VPERLVRPAPGRRSGIDTFGLRFAPGKGEMNTAATVDS
jgi:hypothetical protein